MPPACLSRTARARCTPLNAYERPQPRTNQRRGSYEDPITNMKTRPTQFGVRENTASSGQHASRRAMSGMQSCEPNLVPRESGPSAAQTPLKPTSGATVEEEENDSPEYMVT